jgi:hypothetical protein
MHMISPESLLPRSCGAVTRVISIKFPKDPVVLSGMPMCVTLEKFPSVGESGRAGNAGEPGQWQACVCFESRRHPSGTIREPTEGHSQFTIPMFFFTRFRKPQTSLWYNSACCPGNQSVLHTAIALVHLADSVPYTSVI